MADRYQDRPFSADDYDRGGDRRAAARGEGDPLAELARLIGQPAALGTRGGANQRAPPATPARDPSPQPPEPERELEDDAPPAGPPPWMQRANRQEIQRQDPPQDYPSSVHPLQRYATPRAAPAPVYEEEAPHDDAPQETDSARYNDALYGQLAHEGEATQHHLTYADDGYDYQDGYDEGAEDLAPNRRAGTSTVVVGLALAGLGAP